jgi:hypothetical protein
MEKRIYEAVQPLVGLKLACVGRAGDMRTFQFGQLKRTGRKMIGQYALHIQCPWRLINTTSGLVVTGKDDLYLPLKENADVDIDNWDPVRDGNVQEYELRKLLQGYDEETRQIVNQTDAYTVTAARSGNYGDLELAFIGGYSLSAFPTSSRQEAWRLFVPGSEKEHFVVEFEHWG